VDNKKIKNINKITTEKTEDNECLLCLDNKKDIVFIPCGHVSMCSGCANKFTNTECPCCRKTIEYMYKIYIL